MIFWGFPTRVMENHSKLENIWSMGLHGALNLKISTPMTDLIIVGDIYHHTHSFGQIGVVKPLS